MNEPHFGKLFRALREDRKASVAWLARRSGVSVRHIHGLERLIVCRMKERTALALLTALGELKKIDVATRLVFLHLAGIRRSL